MKIIVDPGSCHYSDKDLAKELIESAKKNGADAIKFQLFKSIPPNFPLNYEWFPELVDYGKSMDIEVFASVWDKEAYNMLKICGCKCIKFAFSQRNNIELINSAVNDFQTVYISSNFFPGKLYNNISNVKLLYCIPEYPVRYLLDFNGIFKRFDGFSDHTFGISQTLFAINTHNCTLVEKHYQIRLGCCEDSKFAIFPNELKRLVSKVKPENLK